MTLEIDLTPKQAEVVRDVIGRFTARFSRIDVYGSRVQGRARPGSDIDLVVHSGDERIAGVLASELEESELSIFADVINYRDAPDRLRTEIDFDAITICVGEAAQAQSGA